MQSCVIVVTLVAAATSACVASALHSELTRSGEAILVYTDESAVPARCRRLQEVVVIDGNQDRSKGRFVYDGTYERALVRLKNQVASASGDAVLIVSTGPLYVCVDVMRARSTRRPGIRATFCGADCGADDSRPEAPFLRRCQVSIHDLRRAQSSMINGRRVPRFNMTFDLGQAVMLLVFQPHDVHVLESTPHRLALSVSDLGGIDPLIHGDNPKTLSRRLPGTFDRTNGSRHSPNSNPSARGFSG